MIEAENIVRAFGQMSCADWSASHNVGTVETSHRLTPTCAHEVTMTAMTCTARAPNRRKSKLSASPLTQQQANQSGRRRHL